MVVRTCSTNVHGKYDRLMRNSGLYKDNVAPQLIKVNSCRCILSQGRRERTQNCHVFTSYLQIDIVSVCSRPPATMTTISATTVCFGHDIAPHRNTRTCAHSQRKKQKRENRCPLCCNTPVQLKQAIVASTSSSRTPVIVIAPPYWSKERWPTITTTQVLVE